MPRIFLVPSSMVSHSSKCFVQTCLGRPYTSHRGLLGFIWQVFRGQSVENDMFYSNVESQPTRTVEVLPHLLIRNGLRPLYIGSVLTHDDMNAGMACSPRILTELSQGVKYGVPVPIFWNNYIEVVFQNNLVILCLFHTLESLPWHRMRWHHANKTTQFLHLRRPLHHLSKNDLKLERKIFMMAEKMENELEIMETGGRLLQKLQWRV